MGWLAHKYIKHVDHEKTGSYHSKKRRVAGIMQVEMAQRLGMTQQTLCDFEKGRRSWTDELSDRYLQAIYKREGDICTEDKQVFADFERRLRAAQEDLPPEFAKVLNDHFWELLA